MTTLHFLVTAKDDPDGATRGWEFTFEEATAVASVGDAVSFRYRRKGWAGTVDSVTWDLDSGEVFASAIAALDPTWDDDADTSDDLDPSYRLVKGAVAAKPQEPAPDSEPILTVPEAARYLRISRAQAYRLAQDGGIPSFRVRKSVRVRRSDLDAWLGDQS